MKDADVEVHQTLFADILRSGRFSTHTPRDGSNETKYVCLTDKECQVVNNRKDKQLCLVLYGPKRNQAKEENTIIHARASFIDDYYGERKLEGKYFAKKNYVLFKNIKNFLTLCQKKPDKSSIYKNDKTYKNAHKNWYFFCLKKITDWPRLDKIVRQFNNLI